MLSALGKELERHSVARRAFLKILLPHLREHGASSLAEIEARQLQFFRLPFTSAEIQDVLELARRQRLVEPLADAQDAYGKHIAEVEWAPTDRGRVMKRPRGFTFSSLGELVLEVFPGASGLAWVVQYALPVLAAVPVASAIFKVQPPSVSAQPSAGGGAFALGVIAVLLMVVVLGKLMQGDRELTSAAASWSRLERLCPRYYRWQVNPLRLWGTTLIFFLTAIFGAMWLFGGGQTVVLLAYFIGIVLLNLMAYHHAHLVELLEKRAAATTSQPPKHQRRTERDGVPPAARQREPV